MNIRGYEHIDKLRCVRINLQEVPNEFFDEVYRAIEVDINGKTLIYTRRSERLDSNVIKLLELNDVEYTFVTGQWQFFDISEHKLYHSLNRDTKHVGTIDIKKVFGVLKDINYGRIYKDNQIISVVKALEKAYKMVFGCTEIELTDDLKNKIINAKKKIVFNKYELIKYEKNLDRLTRAARVVKDLPWISIEGTKDLELEGIRDAKIKEVEIIKSPINKNKECLLFKLSNSYAKTLYESIFDVMNDEEFQLWVDSVDSGIMGYSILLNEDIFKLNTVSINVVCNYNSGLISVNIMTYENTSSCIEDVSKYFGYKEQFYNKEYRLGEVPDRYKLVVLGIIMRKNLLDISNIEELYKFEDIHKVNYINEI